MAMLIPAYTMRFGQSFGWGGMMIFNPSDLPASFKDMCGPGTDGKIVETENTTRSILYCTEYENPTHTITSSGNGIIIFAKKRIVIGGTLDVTGKGAAGGASPPENANGNPGAGGRLLGAGGQGGCAYQKSGGVGGVASDSVVWYDHFLFSALWDMTKGDYLAGPGGGSGGTYQAAYPGGAGGPGGGYIVLFAPQIIVSGILTINGQDGDDGECDEPPASGDGGGGGGGGGGVIWLVGSSIDTAAATINKDGGAGGSGHGANCAHPDGYPGNVGAELKIVV